LSPYFGQGGPVYPTDGTESSTCRRTWWRNLLYINNLFDSDDGCMPVKDKISLYIIIKKIDCIQVTWFLATNMQFHWISPLVLLATSW